jgi:hypothetical protein
VALQEENRHKHTGRTHDKGGKDGNDVSLNDNTKDCPQQQQKLNETCG